MSRGKFQAPRGKRSVEAPEFTAILDHYDIRYVYRHGNQKLTCPFHDESVPSFSINIDEGAFQCFACPARGGDVYAFVMLKENVSFPEAKKIVESITGRASSPSGRSGSRSVRKGKGFRPKFGRKVGE